MNRNECKWILTNQNHWHNCINHHNSNTVPTSSSLAECKAFLSAFSVSRWVNELSEEISINWFPLTSCKRFSKDIPFNASPKPYSFLQKLLVQKFQRMKKLMRITTAYHISQMNKAVEYTNICQLPVGK